MNNKYYDLIIIGGGAAGIMAAITAKRTNPKQTVAIIDRTFALGRKILVCGAGRCNVTNIHLDDVSSSDSNEISRRYYGASKEFTSSIFDQFAYKDIIEFFKQLGVELYTERKTMIGKVFPTTDQAKTITAVLEDELKYLGVEVFLNTECKEIIPGEKFEIKTNPVELTERQLKNLPVDHTYSEDPITFESKYLILSAGGKTYPALGSNGSGYDLATALGHTVITPVPSALPLECSDKNLKKMSGQKMDIEVTSYIEGKQIKQTTDDVMFTDYGISGPAVLNISREISIYLNREKHDLKDVSVRLNFFPGKSTKEVAELLKKRFVNRPNLNLEHSLYGLFPNKIAGLLSELSGTNLNTEVKTFNGQTIEKLAKFLSEYVVQITATRSWNEAEFSAGGVDTTEIKNTTLESTKVSNLYLCGEILDVDGDVGGFNLSWAWASGFAAGKLSSNK